MPSTAIEETASLNTLLMETIRGKPLARTLLNTTIMKGFNFDNWSRRDILRDDETVYSSHRDKELGYLVASATTSCLQLLNLNKITVLVI